VFFALLVKYDDKRGSSRTNDGDDGATLNKKEERTHLLLNKHI